MPRRTTTPDATENARVQREKVKVKEEKDKGKQRARVEEEDEHDQAPEQNAREEEADGAGGEDEDATRSPRGSKRRRTNVDGDSAPSGSGTQPKRENVKTLPRGDDGYIPGSIVRIQLYNFVTYDYVQFYPGTHLNMIIGPNGTGKSSIACAIALGLNFPAAILGRATNLGSYVKIGSETGYIEIELKGPKGRKNLVIRRSINALSNSSSFTLNGVAATGNEIKNKMAELNVQVGNLCSFLPQDRVSEFAAMSPQQLLRETQRAAGDENLENWHDTLISAGKDMREIQQRIRDEENSLKQMKERNEGIENDVQRYKERKKIEHEIGLLKVLVPVAEYRESRVKFVEVKVQQRKLHGKVQKLKDKNAPAHKLLQKMEQDLKEAEKEREKLKNSTIQKFQQLNGKNKASDDLEKDSAALLDKLVDLRKEEDNRVKQIKSLTHEIAKLKEELAKPPPPNLSTEEALQAEKNQLNAERRGDVDQRMALDDELKQLLDQAGRAKVNLQRAEADLARLADADNQKLANMARWDRVTHQAIQWVRANRNLFKMEVFETPFMRLTMKDKRFTSAVEACIGGNMRTFVTQCQEDCDTLNRLVNDNRMFDGKITTWFRPCDRNRLTAPPMSPEQLQQLHFNGYALEYLDYPEGLRWFLEKELNLHRTAIALDGGKVDVNYAMKVVGDNGGATFYCGMTENRVSRSRYGQKALSNATRDIQPAKNLTAPTIDPELQSQIKAAINQARDELAMFDIERARVSKLIDGISERDKGFRRRMDDIKARHDAIKNESRRVQKATAALQAKTESLHVMKNAPSVEEKRKGLKAKLKSNAVRRAKFAKDYTELVHAIIHEQERCTRAGIRWLQLCANIAALKELCSRKDKKYQDTLAQFAEVDKKFKEIKAASKAILERSRAVLDEATDEVRAEYERIERRRVIRGAGGDENGDEHGDGEREGDGDGDGPGGVDDRTAEQLKADLETQEANLAMNLHTNPGVVEQYEKRKRDIEQLEKTLEERKNKEAKIAKQIKTAKGNWQPALETLVARIGTKFSAAFDRIGCAGEIRVGEDEDYEKWAIDIRVKFRASERLQQLTAHRQSGGERSLTTILYLMSLTEEARAPFSLVDEINQGMDQRAERAVHNSMVNVTCRADSAQYFLITPKLLPDLEYHKRMKILCVNNGEWLPEERNIGRMKDMLDVFEAHARMRGAGAAAAAGRGEI